MAAIHPEYAYRHTKKTQDDDYTAPAPDQETFEQLADEWERDRPHGADVEQMTKHPAYQRIIAMGKPAVPWLLQQLAEKPDHWFVALNTITGARPVPPESRGHIKEMTQAWLDWGRQHGYELRQNSDNQQAHCPGEPDQSKQGQGEQKQLNRWPYVKKGTIMCLKCRGIYQKNHFHTCP